MAGSAGVIEPEETPPAPVAKPKSAAESRDVLPTETSRKEPPRRDAEPSRKAEPQIFKAPPAPDDPGAGADEFDDPASVPGSLRVPG
jgi:hypothetical protein